MRERTAAMPQDWEESRVPLDAAEAAWLDGRDADFDAARAQASAQLENADEAIPAVVAAKIRLAWLDAERLYDRAAGPQEYAQASRAYSDALTRWPDATVAPVERAFLHLGRFRCAWWVNGGRWQDGDHADLDAAESLLAEGDQTETRCRYARSRLWSSRGNALWEQGTPEALVAALASHDRAIALREALDLDRPEYRNDLASAWDNRGVALWAQGTQEALVAALASYDRAIALREALDLDRLEYRDALASAWNNRGIALQAQGTPEALVAALASYDRAITLIRAIDRASVSEKTTLGGALYNRGLVLSGLGRKSEARQSCRDSMDVLGALVRGDVIPPTSAEFFCNASWNYMIIYPRDGSSPEATDVGDEALAVLRRLEMQSVFVWRKKREILFPLTIRAYIDADQPHFVPELVLEQLDPKTPGSAPDSVAMQRAAVAGLAEALTRVLGRGTPDGGVSPHVSRIISAQRRLEATWTLYFGGTAGAARLRAMAQEKRGDPAKAEETLRDFVAAHPGDAAGHLYLSGFLTGRRREGDDQARWTAAARLLGRREDLAVERLVAPAVGLIAAGWRLTLARDLGAGTADAARSAGRRAGDWSRDAVDAIRKAARDTGALAALDVNEADRRLSGLRDAAWRLGDALREETEGLADELRRIEVTGTLAARTARIAAYRDGAVGAMLDAIAAAVEVADSAPIGLDDLRATLTEALEANDHFFAGDLARPAARPEERDRLLGEIADGMAFRANSEAVRLDRSELADAEGKLRRHLGDLWDTVLNDDERRDLATAAALLDTPLFARAAPVYLGMAVERMLLNRLMIPAREAVHAAGLPILQSTLPGRHETLVAEFLRNRAPLTFGPLIGIFQKAVTKGEAAEGTVFAPLAARLRALPRPDRLRPGDDGALRRRFRNLDRLIGHRNDAAHPRDATVGLEAAQDSWAIVVGRHPGDPDAFLSYFCGACAP